MNNIKNLKYTEENTFFLIAGPCIIESEEETLDIAKTLKTITDKLRIPFIFKGSFKKANRTRLDSFTGIGDDKALEILKNVKETLRIPIITDVHSIEDVKKVAKIVDVIQIPAFLCRQTELLTSASLTGKHVNLKKGQFLSSENMRFAIEKITSMGNNNAVSYTHLTLPTKA